MAALIMLNAAGVHLKADGDRLIATPKSALTDDVRALIRNNKADLIKLLAQHNPLDQAEHGADPEPINPSGELAEGAGPVDRKTGPVDSPPGPPTGPRSDYWPPTKDGVITESMTWEVLQRGIWSRRALHRRMDIDQAKANFPGFEDYRPVAIPDLPMPAWVTPSEAAVVQDYPPDPGAREWLVSWEQHGGFVVWDSGEPITEDQVMERRPGVVQVRRRNGTGPMLESDVRAIRALLADIGKDGFVEVLANCMWDQRARVYWIARARAGSHTAVLASGAACTSPTPIEG